MSLLLSPVLLVCGAVGLSQSEDARPARSALKFNARYELGWRVRQLERAWAANTDLERRQLALPSIEAAVQEFFGMRLNAAAESLDHASHAVRSGVEGFSCNAAHAWVFEPERRLLDSSAESIALTASLWYRPCVENGAHGSNMTLAARFAADPHPLTFPGVAFGERTSVSLALKGRTPGDLRLTVEASDSGLGSSTHDMTISIVEKCAERLTALEVALGALPETAPRLERESGKALLALLQSLAKGSSEETDYPGARLLAEAEQLVAAAGKGERFYAAPKTGEFWLSVPTSEKRTTRVRVFVPPPRPDGAAPPLVLALHGAGGSENMFFDSYGDGEIVRQCERRGWMLVAPRLGFGGVAAGPLLDALAERFAFDASRVFLVGHSMGAGAGCALVLDQPARYRAFAALGGGQALKNAEKLRNLDVFVAAGERDFGLGGAKQLHASLVAAGCERAQLRVIANTEHLLVVQDALPEVFALFDSLASAAKDTPDSSGR